MSDAAICTRPQGRCADLAYRLAVYEAGHALSARALGFKILQAKMLPRPPALESDKVLHGGSIAGLVELLQDRAIELFGGQIAEDLVCASSDCCSGDVARIDELTRLIAGLEGKRAAEDVWFELEDLAGKIFENEATANAIVPIADFLFGKVEAGETLIDGKEVEALMDKLDVPKRKPTTVSSLLARLTGRG